MNRWFLRGTLMALLTLAACKEPAPPPNPPVPVSVATAELRDVPLELDATGTVEPLQSVSVQAQVSGTLVRVAFREGDEVRQGQVLFEIDPRPYRAALAQARAELARDKAQLANAVADAERYEQLAAQQYVTTQQRDQARTAVTALEATVAAGEAAVEQAELNLQYATIRAPIAGRAGGLLLRAGNLVRANNAQPLVLINQIQPILVRFAVPATQLGAIQRFRGAGILVEAQPVGGGQRSQGRLTFVDNAVDTTTGTILLKAEFPNTGRTLWPGEFVRVRARLTVESKVLVVPATAVIEGQQGNHVFVIKPDSTAEDRPVEVRRSTDVIAVIERGVEPGERVVTDGQLRLRTGAKVDIKPSTAEPDSAARAARAP